ncbi:PREDICTED: uncharacterized protein At4g02000-like [Ipomoea nil]|uniref:uncharacterized protein At4g02000-like n=1 Tax=Ipomoea nil TaxID=35883 RepID=UPI0009019D4E|nr:PREDICTED: uncharacterized protein At4g02000-like [Ipomoea nil]
MTIIEIPWNIIIALLLLLSIDNSAMDVRQIERQCADLLLADEEIGGLDAPKIQATPDGSIHHNLVGRLLTDRQVRFEHMQQVFASVWRPVMGMFAVSLADDLFLFQFSHPKDLQRVIDDGPWSFENNLLICEQVPMGVRPEEVKLESVPFWIQVHGFPTMYASPDFLAKIGEYVGSFIAADPLNFGGAWKSYHRIRVRLSVSSPLKRRMRLKHRDGTIQWITFKYERLSTFCYCCGILGHSDKFCKTVYEEGILPEAFPFGAWLRAGPRRQVKPVGAKWLLQTPTAEPEPSSLPPVGPPPVVIVGLVESGGLQGDLKRRREEEGTAVSGSDVLMTDTTKNHGQASLTAQTHQDK